MSNVIDLDKRRYDITEKANPKELLLDDDGNIVGLSIYGNCLEFCHEMNEIRFTNSSGGMAFTFKQFMDFIVDTGLFHEIKGWVNQNERNNG